MPDVETLVEGAAGPPVELTAQVLVDGDHEITARATGVVELVSPVPVTIDLETLVTR